MSGTLRSHGTRALPSRAPAAARAVSRLLPALDRGTLDIEWPDGTRSRYGNGQPPHAAMRLDDWEVCSAALRSGDIGLARGWINGGWTSPDPVALLRLFLINRERIQTLVYGRGWLAWLYRLRHLGRRNTRSGSRANVHTHYDLGNSFYRLWLDPTMSYSSACFDGDAALDLAAAQRAKMRRMLGSCGVRAGERLLELGCGWGALAETALREFGAQVVGVTLSGEQLGYARQRLATAGLAADLRLQDWRDIDEQPFDAIVSVEMFEAVGREYWPRFFERIRHLLRPGGHASIQSITIRDDLFERYAGSTDFIQQYVFPGGLLPSRQVFRREVERAGLAVVNEFAFGADYALTLQRWRSAFLMHEEAVRALGFDQRFIRLWHFYLAYCEAAFATGNTDVVQFTLRRR